MKSRIKIFGQALILFIAGIFFYPLHAQNEATQAVKDALEVWDFLSANVKVGVMTEKNEAGSTIATGSVTAFDQKSELEVTFGTGKSIERIAIILPKMTQLNVQYIRSLAGKSIQEIVPEGLGAAIRYERIELDFEGKRVKAGRLFMSAGTWTPIQGQTLKLNTLELVLGITNPQSSTKRGLELKLRGTLFLPEDLSRYLSIGESELALFGTIDTDSGDFSLGVDLSSKEIPLHPQKLVVLRQAKLEFYLENRKDIGLALGGQIELRPPNQPDPILLTGEISIDLTGEIFGQGYLTGYWKNPFGLSDQLYITQAGAGFGLDFKTLPAPMPIVAFEGGFSVGSPNPELARFGGKVTVGFHGADPTQNMIDAQIYKVSLNDIVSAFYPQGVPPDMAEICKQVQLRDARLTIVPPGDGVELFGNKYEPGIHVQGYYDVGDFTGSMLISIDEDGVVAYAGMTPIKTDGFSFTSASDPSQGPEAFIEIKKAEGIFPPVKGFFGLNGKLNVLGLEAGADIYLSDAGFSATVTGQIMGGFQASLDIAGADLFSSDGGIYIKAELQSDLTQKINREAADRIGEYTKETQDKYDQAREFIKRNKPREAQLQSEYEAARRTVQAEYNAQCNRANDIRQQKEAREREKQNYTDKIDNLEREARGLDQKIASGYSRANFNRSTSVAGCPDGSFYDAIEGGGCWSCPAGYTRDHTVAINNPRACVKKGRTYKKAVDKGPAEKDILGFATVCPSGLELDKGHCWQIPVNQGYARDILRPIDHAQAFFKDGEERVKGLKIQDRSCTDGFVVPRNGGECWSCPSGYIRPWGSTIDVTSQLACEKPDLPKWKDRRAEIDREILSLKALRDVVISTMADLEVEISKISNDVCKMASDVVLVDADPRVNPKKEAYEKLRNDLAFQQTILDASEFVTIGTLKATEWVVRNGGEALGVVNITRAYFSGCASLVKGGNIALHVEGTFADQPIDVSFDLNLASPEQSIKAFADLLMGTNTADASLMNGTCTRPNVARPDLSNSVIAEFKRKAKNKSRIQEERPKTKARPDWAGKPRFAESRSASGAVAGWGTGIDHSVTDAGTDMNGTSNNTSSNGTDLSGGSDMRVVTKPDAADTGSDLNINNKPGNPDYAAQAEQWYEKGKTEFDAEDFTGAFYSFTKAKELGHPGGYAGLGVMYIYGLSVTADYSKALSLLTYADERQITIASHYLGKLYFIGLGVEIDVDKSIEYFKKAAYGGIEEAKQYLQYFGVFPTQRTREQIKSWISEGNVAYNRQDYTEAIRLYKLVGEAGDRDARAMVGVLYYNGMGVESNPAEAHAWFIKAAIQGHPKAQMYVGDQLLTGYGTEKNLPLAIYWYKRAAANGLKEAADKLKELGR